MLTVKYEWGLVEVVSDAVIGKSSFVKVISKVGVGVGMYITSSIYDLNYSKNFNHSRYSNKSTCSFSNLLMRYLPGPNGVKSLFFCLGEPLIGYNNL